MNQVHYLTTMAVLLVSTALYTSFVFIPTISPYEVVNVEIATHNDQVLGVEIDPLPTLSELLYMEEGSTKILGAKILNRQLPSNWLGKDIYFKYTYIGEYNPQTETTLNDLLLGEYKWQKQLDEKGNAVLGGIILSKDGTYQLHTHNTFSKGEKFFLLGDLLDKYNSEGNLVGTKLMIGNVVLENIWAKDVQILEDNSVEYADLIISTCLERNGDRRLVSGWNILRE